MVDDASHVNTLHAEMCFELLCELFLRVHEIARRDVVGACLDFHALCVYIISPLCPFDPFDAVCVSEGVKDFGSLVVGVSYEAEDSVRGLLDSVGVVASDEDAEAHELFVGHPKFPEHKVEFDLIDEFVVDDLPHDSRRSVRDRVGVGGVHGGHDSLLLQSGGGALGLGFRLDVRYPEDFTESLCLVDVFGGEVRGGCATSVLFEVGANVSDLFGGRWEVFVFVGVPVVGVVGGACGGGGGRFFLCCCTRVGVTGAHGVGKGFSGFDGAAWLCRVRRGVV